MTDSPIPPWVSHLSTQIGDFRREVNERLDKLVTRDAFMEEQKRVNEKFDSHGREISALKADLQAEATARAAAELATATSAKEEAQERQRTTRQTSWQWFALFATPAVGIFVIWFVSNGAAVTAR